MTQRAPGRGLLERTGREQIDRLEGIGISRGEGSQWIVGAELRPIGVVRSLPGLQGEMNTCS